MKNHLKRYFFKICYDGSKYHGWQRQNNSLGIQQVIEEALSQLFNTKIDVVGSGRTDTNVHAKQQFFHCDLPYKEVNHIVPQNFKFKLNCMLSQSIAIQNIYISNSEDAHARFSALEREYKYYIHSIKNPFLNGKSTFHSKPLDILKINQATSYLLGKKDFQCFSNVHTQVNHFVCDIRYAKWEKFDDKLVFTIVADRFLRGMVRNIVGTLLSFGKGEKSTLTLNDIIDSKNRQNAGISYPAEGLYLTRIKYDKNLMTLIA